MFGQSSWDLEEVGEIVTLAKTDVPGAVALIGSRATPYDFGIKALLQSGEGQKAIDWFNMLTVATDEHKYVYGAAWSKWKTGDNKGALKDALYLSHQELSPLLQARNYYLLGSICLESRLLDDAGKYLTAGLKSYQAIDKYGGQYLCLTLLAAVEMRRGSYDRVEPLLRQALEADRLNEAAGYNGHGMGRFHDILAEMYFLQGDYPAAIEANRKARTAYLGMNKQMAADGAYVKIGILNLIMGQTREAHAISVELWNRHQDGGRVFAYNNIILAKLSKCGRNEADYQTRANSARSWARDAPGGAALSELFDFVLKQPCPEIQVEE